MISETQAKSIVEDLVSKFFATYEQELDGENDDSLNRVMLQHRAKLARYSWKEAQHWCKWDDDGVVLMPEHTRLYYRKGKTEIVLQEFTPQIRLMKFKDSLARKNTEETSLPPELQKTRSYSLALPYVVFIFKFVNGVFGEVKCAFCDRPLKRLDERPLRPYLSNIDSTMAVCLGRSFDRHQLVEGDLNQQVDFVLHHFWNTTYSDEWSGHFWENRRHFQANDSRMATFDAWQAASVEDALFVVENVKWLKHDEESFGDMIVRMVGEDAVNYSLQNQLYENLTKTFLDEFKTAYKENIGKIKEKFAPHIEQWSKSLTELKE